jgi:hypothetical protein
MRMKARTQLIIQRFLLARHSDRDLSFLPGCINELEQLCQCFDEDRLRTLLAELVPAHEQNVSQRGRIIPIHQGRT